jgi:hypothetical protein
MHQPPAYTDRIVAFIDILGFKDHVLSFATDPERHGRIHYALSYIKSYCTLKTMQSSVEVSVFSDSVAITASPLDAFDVIWRCGWLHATLLFSGILTRGGISVGPTFHANDILYGEGMVTAHYIESKVAVYPRIIVDPKLFSNLRPELKQKFLDEDSDGCWFVDPFKFDALPGGAEDLVSEGYDPRDIYFKELYRHIDLAIKEAKQLDHLTKWTWLANKHRIASATYSQTRKMNCDTWIKAAE